MDGSDIFYFCLLGAGEGGRLRRWGWGIGFLLKIPKGGGGGPGGAEGPAGRVSVANWEIFGGGGGLNIFFRGRNVHQVKVRGGSLPSTLKSGRGTCD